MKHAAIILLFKCVRMTVVADVALLCVNTSMFITIILNKYVCYIPFVFMFPLSLTCVSDFRSFLRA